MILQNTFNKRSLTARESKDDMQIENTIVLTQIKKLFQDKLVEISKESNFNGVGII